MLIPHIPVTMATITLFLSQMAMLAATISFAKSAAEVDAHAKHDQQRRGSEGKVS
jgi:hypothetical protein